MSLFGAFYSGISGLNSNGLSMSVISDNLANMNTVGFKRSRANFQDLMSFPVIGVGTESYVGRGAVLSKVEQQMTQGSFISTGNGLDMAVQGNGFFVVNGDFQGQQGENFYSRAGQFHVDKDGYLVNLNSMRLQGYLPTGSGAIGTSLTDMQLKDSISPALATNSVEMAMNLNSQSPVVDRVATPFDATDADTYQYQNSVTVYDSLGVAQDVEIFFTKTAEGPDPVGATWEFHAMIDDGTGTLVEQGTGQLSFNTDGALQTVLPNPMEISFDFPGGATQGQTIAFDFGDPISDGGTGLDGTTGYGADFGISFKSQNGYPTGDLQTVVVDENGMITGTFTNGQRRSVGQIALADFRGVGLRRMGSNLWQETNATGQALIGAANSGTRGGIASSVLEQSNVDLAEEFVDMIVAQRGYQANSRTITTADQLLQETLNLKR